MTFEQIQPDLNILQNVGMSFQKHNNILNIHSKDYYRSQYITISPEGVMTDHPPFYAVLLHKAKKISRIHELVWYERFAYVDELRKFALTFRRKNGMVDIVPGKAFPYNGVINGCDLRVAAAIMILATGLDGETVINGYNHILRGYSNLVENFQSLGMNITVTGEEMVCA